MSKKRGQKLNWMMSASQRKRKSALLQRERAYRKKKGFGG